jgi:hypothetical protein
MSRALAGHGKKDFRRDDQLSAFGGGYLYLSRFLVTFVVRTKLVGGTLSVISFVCGARYMSSIVKLHTYIESIYYFNMTYFIRLYHLVIIHR